MLEKVFYGVPKELGYYDGYEDEDSIYDECPSPSYKKKKKDEKVSVSYTSTNSKDDNFKQA
jgi:hypothetical protein